MIDIILKETKELSSKDRRKIALFSKAKNLYGSIFAINKIVYKKYFEKDKQITWKDNKSVSKIIIKSLDNYIVKLKDIFSTSILFEYNLLKTDINFREENSNLESFLENTTNDFEWINYFFRKYPVLELILKKSMKFAFANINTLVERFIEDENDLFQMFRIKGSEIQTIESFQGDFHNKWQSPVKLVFDDNICIYYKNRNIYNETFLYEICNHFSKLDVNVNIGRFEYIYRTEYVWVKGIGFRECDTEKEVKWFFNNQGKLLAIFYFFNASDLISDNIILNKNIPYFYDLEVFLAPSMSENLENHLYESYNQATRFINNSVLKTNLIPQYGFVMKNFQGVSNSGLSLTTERGIPDYKLEYGNGKFNRVLRTQEVKGDNNHLPSINGVKVGAAGHLSDIIDGFIELYEAIVKNRSSILSFIKNIDPIKSRVLYRPSYVYGKLLSESLHPKYLTSIKKFRNFFKVLFEAAEDLKGNEEIIKSEYQQILNLDIPYFYTFCDSLDIFHDGRRVKNGFFATTGLDNSLNKVKLANKTDMFNQIKIIKMSFSIHDGFIDEDFEPVKSPPINKIMVNQANLSSDENVILQESLLIADKIIANGFKNEDGNLSFWGLTQSPQSTWVIRSKEWGLFDGLDGLSLFFLNLYNVTNESEYHDLGASFLKRGVKQFIKYEKFYQNQDSFNKISLFNYPLSSCYVLELFHGLNIIDNDLHLEFINRVLSWVQRNFIDDRDFDLISGGSGCIICLIKIFENHGLSQSLYLAKQIGDLLIEKAIEEEGTLSWISIYGKRFTGFSHGVSGISYSLFLLYSKTNSCKYYNAGIKALAFEDMMFDRNNEYWYYFLWNQNQQIEKMEHHFWAYGSGGILQSRILISQLIDGISFERDFQVATRNILQKGPYINHNYSSGLFGNLDVLNNYSSFKSDEALNSKLKEYLISLVSSKGSNHSWVCAPIGESHSLVELDGLFSGLSGIGNTMLNIGFGEKTKKLFYSILLLFWSTFSLSAQDNYTLSARIDTTNEEVMEVVDLWMNYLHSKPDSIYDNPYWEQKDRIAHLEAGMPAFDMGSMFMFRGGYSSEQFIKEYEPTILSIDEVQDGEKNVYNIKTLFYSERLAKDSIYSRYKVPYITSYYCVKVSDGYKLRNAFPIIVSDWQKFKVGFLHYIVHPSEKFNRKEAEAALDSCEKLVRRFNLERPDSISYVVATNVNVMGQLYNFDYWLSYSTGLTHTSLNRIVLCDPNFNHLHELIHILFQREEWTERGRPFIINEGLATYFAGPGGGNDFTEQLISFSKEVRHVEDLSLTDIIDRNYAHDYDNNPIYLTGGFIFKLVDEKHGTPGILELFNCGRKEDEFQSVIEKLFDMPYEEFDTWIISELKSFSID